MDNEQWRDIKTMYKVQSLMGENCSSLEEENDSNCLVSKFLEKSETP